MNVSHGSLADLIRRQGKLLGERTAFIAPGRCWSYSRLDAESNRVAQGFRAAGIAPGDTVACLSKHAAECVIWTLAASKAGAVAILLNWRLAAPELEHAIGVVQPKILLFDDFLRPTLDNVAMPSVQCRLATDAPADAAESMNSWAASYAAKDPGHQPAPDSVAVRLFSSGTTGRPKAIELSQRALLAQCTGWNDTFGYSETTRHLNTLPTFHVSGLVNALWMLLVGGEVIFQPQFVPQEYLAAIETHRVTDLFVVPAMLRSLINAPETDAADLSSLRTVAYGGSPIDTTLLEQSMRRFGCGFLQVYGMTEAAGTLTALCPADHLSGARRSLLHSVGKPAPHIALKIVDPVTGVERAAGETGELWVRSVQNMAGYLNDPAATRAAFPLGRDEHGGWLRTGDGGYLEQGYVYLRDRVKDMIISGGENVYPAEVEDVLAQHPAILEAAVIGVPHQKWGETVKACLVFRDSAEVTPGEIIAFTRERLAHYKCPTSVDVLPALPRNPSGKVLKRVLRERHASN